MFESSHCSTFSPTFGIVNLCNCRHSGKTIMASQMALICIPLMTNDTELSFCHLFIFFVEMSVQTFCLCFYWVFEFLSLSCKSYLYSQMQVLFTYTYCKYFLPVCCLPFHLLSAAFKRTEIFNFDEFLYIKIFLLWFVFSVSYLNFLPTLRLTRFSTRSFMAKTTLESHMEGGLTLIKFHMHLPYNPRIPLVGIYLRETKMQCSWEDLNTNTYNIFFYDIPKWKCPNDHEQVNG